MTTTLKNKIYSSKIKGYDINGIELHKVLNLKSNYSSWVLNKKTELQLLEGRDYVTTIETDKSINHFFTLASTLTIINTLRNSKQVKLLKRILSCSTPLLKHKSIELKKSNIIVFTNKIFGEIRTLEFNSKPYFVARDIALKLGYSNSTDAIKRHCKGVVKYDVLTNGGIQETSIIPESDLYRLIIRSKLPEAEKFESWIMEDVLPSIRKNGFYATTSTVDAFLNDPDSAMKILSKYKEEREEKEKLLAEAKMNEPKLVAYDDFINSNDLYTFATGAKVLAIPRTPHSKTVVGKNTLLSWLRRDGILIALGEDRNTPYQSYLNRGWFEVIAAENDSTGKRVTVMLTPKGIEGLYRKYKYTSMPKKIDISSMHSAYDDLQNVI